MAPGGVPGIAASVVANGGTIYKGLVAAVRRNADYDELKAEALEAVLNMFGRAKSKAAFRDRSKELAEMMVGAGLTIWEDLRGVDLAWLETTVGVPHFEALAFFRFLDDSAQQQEEEQAAAAAWAAELEEELEELEDQVDEPEEEFPGEIASATSDERRQEREEEQQQQQQQQPRQRPRKAANPKPFAGMGASAASGSETESEQLSVQESVALMARTITEGQLAIQAAAQHAGREKLPALSRSEDDYMLPSVRVTVQWLGKVKKLFADVEGLQEAIEKVLLDPLGTVAADLIIADPGEHV